MKILWFANTPCGATEILNKRSISGGWLVSLEKELIKHDNLILSICFYSDNEMKPFTFENTLYYPIYRQNSASKIVRYINRLLNKNNNDNTILPKLLSVINHVKPNIIHIHGTEENFGLIQKHIKIPVVVSIQGILNPITEKYYSGISEKIVKKYESFYTYITKKSANDIFKNFKAKSKRELEIFKHTKYIIGRTDWDRQVTRCLSPNSKYFVNNELLRASFYLNKWDKSSFSNPIQLITITSDGLFKGFETIVKVSTLLKQLTSFSFEWTIIGLTSNSKIVKIVEKWFNIFLPNLNINLVGQKSENEIVSILLNSDIYCQISHIENSSNSLCEAMLLGMPIIATDVGGTASLLVNKHEGILVQEGEPYSYAGAIVEMAMNYKAASQYAQYARNVALKRHNKDYITDTLIDLYIQLSKQEKDIIEL